jgi:hypothetical protein
MINFNGIEHIKIRIIGTTKTQFSSVPTKMGITGVH